MVEVKKVIVVGTGMTLNLRPGVKPNRYAWNDFADRAFNPAVGCSRGCEYCWARRQAKRRKPTPDNESWNEFSCVYELYRGCQQCYDFKVHDHFERWEKFRAKAGERIAFGYMGDLFDPARSDEAICTHMHHAIERATSTFLKGAPCSFLIQTRHVSRAVAVLTDEPEYDGSWTDAFMFNGRSHLEIGTTFAGPEDIENVRALGELPADVVRFVAFEPCDWIWTDEWWQVQTEFAKVISAAEPDWIYIGPQTGPGKQAISESRQQRIEDISLAVQAWAKCEDTKVIYKKSCGSELYARNEGVGGVRATD